MKEEEYLFRHKIFGTVYNKAVEDLYIDIEAPAAFQTQQLHWCLFDIWLEKKYNISTNGITKDLYEEYCTYDNFKAFLYEYNTNESKEIAAQKEADIAKEKLKLERRIEIGLEPKTENLNEHLVKKGEVNSMPNQPTCLNEVFSEGTRINDYIDFLRNVNPPIIDANNHYLLGVRQKGSIVAWVDVLKSKGKLKKVTDGVLANILNKEIPGLDLSEDGRTLRNTSTTAHTKYRKQFLILIT